MNTNYLHPARGIGVGATATSRKHSGRGFNTADIRHASSLFWPTANFTLPPAASNSPHFLTVPPPSPSPSPSRRQPRRRMALGLLCDVTAAFAAPLALAPPAWSGTHTQRHHFVMLPPPSPRPSPSRRQPRSSRSRAEGPLTQRPAQSNTLPWPGQSKVLSVVVWV